MKKVILAIALFSVSAAAIAASNDANKKLVRDLSATLNSAAPVKWKSISNYNKAIFVFKGQTISAYYNATDAKLVGFFIRQNSLPMEMENAIRKNYSNWAITETQMFIDPYGGVCYYAKVKNAKSERILKITTNGKVSVYAKAPYTLYQNTAE